WLDDPGPADVQRLFDAIDDLKEPPIALILPLLRYSCYDDFVVDRLIEPLLKGIELSTPTQQLDLADAFREVWRRSFWVMDDEDLAFTLGRLYSALGEHTDGIQMYEESLQTKGPHRATYYNLALSYEGLDDLTQAHRHMDMALQLAPGYKRALKWKGEVEPSVIQGS
ncbi:MAG: tetratricopeptide (TPR) repeat protein, partial [Kiritimatiellia bacterium]